VVKRWVDWYKRHREILESDVVHVRRADGRNLDAVLHANPHLETKAMGVIYNPVDHAMKQEMMLPLHFSGLKGRVTVSVNDGPPTVRSLDAQSRLLITVDVPAKSCVWVTVR
jgi:hypothetical protein